LFVGLLTHPNSLYQEQTATIRKLSNNKELNHSFLVEDRNLATGSSYRAIHRLVRPLAVTTASVLWSIHRELSLVRSLKEIVGLVLATAAQILRRCDITAMQRNENIARAHLSLWSYAIRSGQEFAVILEDDASGELDSLIAGGEEFLRQMFDLAGPNCWIVFLSDSFNTRTLGVERIIDVVKPLGKNQSFLVSRKGFSDTLCATAFKTNELISLRNWVQKCPVWLLRTLPIDWLLNIFFLQRALSSKKVVTGHLVPGLFTQGSMSWKSTKD
jgi:hypothetical protein